MQVKKVTNTTTIPSPVQYEVLIRITSQELRSKTYETDLSEIVKRAIEGIA